MTIVVSGIGLVTPLGSTRESTWSRLLDGSSAIQKSPRGLEARITDFSPNGARSRMGDFAILAAQEAIRHAGFTLQQLQNKNVAVVIGQSKPIVEEFSIFNFQMDPLLLMSSFTGWSANDVVRREFQLNGTSLNVVAACATGVAAIQMGEYLLAAGHCDVALVGAAESSLNDFYRAGFNQMGVLAMGNEKSARPFDANRTGFVMGEGAAVLVLETDDAARKRQHSSLAKITKTVLQHSAHDLVKSDMSGHSVERLINAARQNKKINYINAHGTGTKMNDAVETRGIHLSLGNDAKCVAISSTKAATGHLLGAAGAVEAAFAVLAIRDQVAPPTLNLETADPICDLDYIPLRSRPMKIDAALSLSYGFGGQMGAVLFSKG